jgi:hypothetical protein
VFIFFVMENNDENYNTTNNTNAWPIVSPYCPALHVNEATNRNSISFKCTSNQDIRDDSSVSSSSADDEISVDDKISEDDDIMSPPNISKRKTTYAYLQHGLRHTKASLKRAKHEVRQFNKQHNVATRQILILNNALGNAQSETNYHCFVAAKLEASLFDITGLKADPSKGLHTLNHLTYQLNCMCSLAYHFTWSTK